MRPSGVRPWRAAALAGGLASVAATLAACAPGGGGGGPATLRVGYLANLTHAPALVGIAKGFLQDALGSSATLTPTAFRAGPSEVEAIFGGALDAAYLGPSAAVTAFARSQGDAIRIVSGATDGGAALVVRAGITSPDQLRGLRLASPQLGNTQDVALRAWLLDHGLHTDTDGGGDVRVVPEENAQTLALFRRGGIDGAWVPEPWATRMVAEGHGTVLVDESSLWPQGRFPTAQLVVARAYLDAHPDRVRALVAGNARAVAYLTADRAGGEAASNAALATLTGALLAPAVLDAAWSHLRFTVDPELAATRRSVDNAVRVGTVRRAPALAGIADARFLDDVLRGAGQPAVDTAGLGVAP